MGALENHALKCLWIFCLRGNHGISLQRLLKRIELLGRAREHAIDALMRHEDAAEQRCADLTQPSGERLGLAHAGEVIESDMKKWRIHSEIIAAR